MTGKNQHHTLAFFDKSFLGKAGKKSQEERARKIVAYAPEVMVKVTGFTKSSDHMKSHLNYISRNGDLPLEDEREQIFSGKEEILELFDDWHAQQGVIRNNSRYTTHLVLSMPYGTDEKILQKSVKAFAEKTFSNHRYVMVLHLDTDNPHMHLSVHNEGFNRRKLHIKRGDPQRWRETFAAELDIRGINAEATPRALRGVILKPLRQSLNHIKARGIKLYTGKGMIDSIRQSWKQSKPERPWETAIKTNQATLRSKWFELAEIYKNIDNGLSKKIKDFVDKMPLPLTKRELINRSIFQSIREPTQAKKLLHDHSELTADIDTIQKAETYAKQKYSDPQQQEIFIRKVINDVADKRLQRKEIEQRKSQDYER